MASIEKRGDNSWRLTVELGLDATGERIRERRTIKIEDKAILRAPKRLREHLEQELAKFRMEIEAGELKKPEKMKFSAFADMWRNEFAPKHYSPRTYKNYVDRLDSHILPYFERMYLDEIKPMHILRFKNYLDTPEARMDGKEGPQSRSTQLFIFKVFTSMLKAAKDDLKVIVDNPAASIAPPKVPKNKKKKEHVFSQEEAARVVVAMLKLPTLWMLYFFGAMFGAYRRGELLALEWSNVDFDENRIYVSQSISWTENGQAFEKGTKEDNEEWVAMPRWYMRELKKFRDGWYAEREDLIENGLWQGGDREYVFHNETGKPYYHDTPTHTWRKFLQRNGLRHIKLHGLRHTAATLLLEDGVALSLIQGHLRHESNETTDEFYAHFTKKAARVVADHFEKFDPIQLLEPGDEVGTDWGRDSSVGDRNRPLRSIVGKNIT